MMASHQFELPPLLTSLIANGRWPQTSKEALSQNLRSWIPAERVRNFAKEEDKLYLCAPPFRTIAGEIGSASKPVLEFWSEFGALNDISPEEALIIADFGLGSDSPIILHYRDNPRLPCVLRLRWSSDTPGKTSNKWVMGARSFDEFAEMLGLGTGPREGC